MPIPADHAITVEAIGLSGLVKMILKAGLNYRHTTFHLLNKGKFKSLYNFLYTKTLVPTGEGSGELAYYFIGPIIQRHPKLAPFPKFIEVEVTTRCNKRCIICEHTWWKEPSTDLTFDEFKHLVDQFDLHWVNLTGEGDAFLNKDYLSMIRYSKQKGTSVYLVDSFDLITPDVSYELVNIGVDGIYISMDGAMKDTYEVIKVGCTFDRVLSNIQGLLDAKRYLKSPIPELCFRFTVNSNNVREMASFVSLVESMASRQEWGDGSKIHFVGLLDYPEIHHLYLDTIPVNYVDAALKASTDMPVVFAHLEDGRNPSINRCLAWMEPYFALVPHPMVLPCCAVLMSNSRTKLSEYCFGDYTKESMRNVWNHPYYKWFRSTVTRRDAPIPMLCKGCRAYNTAEREQRYGIDARKREDFE